MTITLYKYSSEPNRLNKTAFLTAPIYGVDCTIKGTFTADAPELLLSYKGDLSGYNYALCTFNGADNYYYVRIAGEIGGKIRAICTRDPLMTARAQILNCDIIARRTSQRALDTSGAGFNAYLPDNSLPVIAPTKQDFYLLHTFAWGDYVLVTIG